MDILLKSFAVMFSLLCLSCTHTKATDSQMTYDEFMKVCTELCTNGPACPSQCPQRKIGPWAKRSLRFVDFKRYYNKGLHRSNGVQGLFDDYGMFMKYLGRNI